MVLIRLYGRFRLSKGQLKQLADFSSNLGLVFLAGVVTPLFSGVDRISLLNVVLGIVLMLMSVSFSLFLLKGD